MLPPTLKELPLPPSSNKIGWPWTEENLQLSGTIPSGSQCPRITVVTPSYNQGHYIEETIRSVLLQGYPNLDYIIIDGGSTDNSVDIIRKYELWITYWISEPDRGQSHAINKGFARATGDLLGWINSDDLLLPGALQQFARAFDRANPDIILAGDVVNYTDHFDLTRLVKQKNISFETMVAPWHNDMLWHQPGIYFSKRLYQKIGDLDETLSFIFDRDWLCRALLVTEVHYLDCPVAQFRLHTSSKTVQKDKHWFDEEIQVCRRYQSQVPLFNERKVLADFELYVASISLRLQNFDRWAGLKHLVTTIRYNWQILMTFQGIVLLSRALTPTVFLHWARTIRHAWLRRSEQKRLL